METYYINLSKIAFEDQSLYTGTVIKLSPTSEQKNTISFGETIARTSKDKAIQDINPKAENLDYVNDKIIFIPTMERLASFKTLTLKLDQLTE